MTAEPETELHCVYVLEAPPPYVALEFDPLLEPSIDHLRQVAEKRMATFIKQHLEGLRQPVARILVGRPVEEIVAYARDQDAALIIMPTHGYSGLRHALLGSTAEGVLRHAKCPVLAVRGT